MPFHFSDVQNVEILQLFHYTSFLEKWCDYSEISQLFLKKVYKYFGKTELRVLDEYIQIFIFNYNDKIYITDGNFYYNF